MYVPRSPSGKEINLKIKEYLLKRDLYKEYRSAPEEVLTRLSFECQQNQESQLLLILMTLSFQIAPKKRLLVDRMRFFLSSCVFVLTFLQQNVASKKSLINKEIYAGQVFNMAFAEFLRLFQKKGFSFAESHEFQLLQGSLTLVHAESLLPLGIKKYLKFIVCEDVPINKKLKHIKSNGIGVPVIAITHEHNTTIKPELIKGMLFHLYHSPYPATAFLDVKKNKRGEFKGQVSFLDPRKSNNITINDREIPLAADFSKQISYSLKNGHSYTPFNSLAHAKFMHTPECLCLFSPYDENKIPLVLVHGFMSGPPTWLQMINNLLGDDVIRSKYQIWIFAYLTSYPVLMSAYKLRQSLSEAHDLFNPENQNPNFSKMVLMGHSMGGLLAKTMAIDVGDKLIQLVFGDKLENLKLNGPLKELVEKVMIFEPLPFVNRLLFLATPHYGSEMTHWKSMKLAAWFIHRPKKLIQDLLDIKPLIKEDVGVNVEKATSVEGLDPRNRIIQFINNLPLQAKFNSIMGNAEKANEINGSDGIVDYHSSHLDGAESELVIHSGHNVQKKPAGIKEVRRILRLHLDETSGKRPGS